MPSAAVRAGRGARRRAYAARQRAGGPEGGGPSAHTRLVNEHIQNTRVDAPPLAPHGRNTHIYRR